MDPDSGSEAPGSDFDPGHSHSHKKSCYFNQKKLETMKHRNWIGDHISETVFPRLHFQDHSPKITGIGTEFMGLHFRDHGNRDFILNIMEPGSRFFNYGNRIKFLISRNWDEFLISWESAPHFQDHGTGSALPRSWKWHFKLTKGDKIIKMYN